MGVSQEHIGPLIRKKKISSQEQNYFSHFAMIYPVRETKQDISEFPTFIYSLQINVKKWPCFMV